jgi:hypothetical protein
MVSNRCGHHTQGSDLILPDLDLGGSPTDLEGPSFLEIFQLEVDLGSGHPAKCGREDERGAKDFAFENLGGILDVG